jgi:hypothetical protein
MKANALKLAGVKTEAEFYKKYPTQKAFMQEHGDAYNQSLPSPDYNMDFENFKSLKEAQYGQSVHTQNMVQNLEDNGFNRTMNALNSMGDPRNMINQLPNRGFLGSIKAAAGIGAGLAGAIQGPRKLAATDATYTPGSFSSHQNDFASMPNVGYDYQAPTTTAGTSGFGRDPYDAHFAPAPEVPKGFGRGILPDSKASHPFANPNAMPKSYDMNQGWRSQELDYNNELPEAQYGKSDSAPNFFSWYQANSGRGDVASLAGNNAAVNDIFKRETASNASQGFNSKGVKRGDPRGMQMAYNSINGFAMANQALGAQDYEKQYNQRLRDMGNTDAKYGANNADNPFGNFTMNTGAFANQALVQGVPVQDFGTKMAMARQGGQVYEQGGEYTATPDDIQRLKDQGYDIEYLD